MQDKTIIKIINSDKVQEIDVSHGYVLLYTPDDCGVVEHGVTYGNEMRGAFAAMMLINLSDEQYEQAVSFAEEERDRESTARKRGGLTLIDGGSQ